MAITKTAVETVLYGYLNDIRNLTKDKTSYPYPYTMKLIQEKADKALSVLNAVAPSPRPKDET